jgi:hypothetical protein
MKLGDYVRIVDDPRRLERDRLWVSSTRGIYVLYHVIRDFRATTQADHRERRPGEVIHRAYVCNIEHQFWVNLANIYKVEPENLCVNPHLLDTHRRSSAISNRTFRINACARCEYIALVGVHPPFSEDPV